MHSTLGRNSMLMRLCLVSMMTFVIALPLMAQDPGGRGAQRGDRGGGNAPGGQRGGAGAPGGAAPAMTLAIPGFPDGAQIPVKFSQAAEGAAPGEGTSPAMSWANTPAGTQSFVLNMRDMDVARNKTTDDQAHWVVWNIPAATTSLPEGVPKGSQRSDGSYQ